MRLTAGLALTIGLALVDPTTQAASLKDIDPNLMAAADCPFDAGCEALVLLDETELSNAKLQARLSRRRVIKLFTADGVQKRADLDVIETPGLALIRGMTGRTILPDGSVLPLRTVDVGVKTVVKRGKRRLVVKTAKFPGLVPGAVVEYAYDVIDPRLSNYSRYVWEPQEDLPVLESRLVLKAGELHFGYQRTGADDLRLETTALLENSRTFRIVNVPAFPDEPMAPPRSVVKFKVHLFDMNQQATWLGRFAGILAGMTGKFIDKRAGVPEKVRALTTPSDSPAEKVRKIYRFIQASIGEEEKRIEETEESKVRDATNVGEVLSRGYGNEYERTMLFLAMIKESGLETDLLVIAGRGTATLNTDIPDESQFDSFAVAVKTSEDWTFYDPAARHCPFGMISAEKEGGGPNALQLAPRKPVTTKLYATGGPNLVAGPAPYKIVAIPYSAAAKNILSREATATVGEDGSVDVEVSDQGTGLVDVDLREEFEALEAEKRAQRLMATIRKTLPAATLESASFDQIGSFDEPTTIRYRLKVPGYAAVAGDRIILMPSLLNAGKAALFTVERRRTAVYFPHRQRTIERIVFRLPQGYGLGELPPTGVVREGPFLLMTTCAEQEGQIVFTRRLDIDAAVWPAEEYDRVKSFFDNVRDVDRQVVVLKRTPTH